MNQLKILSPLLITLSFLCIIEEVTAVTLRGSAATNDLFKESRGRRHLLLGITCGLFLKDIEFGPTRDQPGGYFEENWVCELSQKETQRLHGLRFVNILGAEDIVSKAISGKSTLMVSECTIDTNKATMHIPDKAVFELDNNTDADTIQLRKLMSINGTLQTLVIRVSDSNGIGPNANASQLRNDIFEDDACLKSQFEACSYDQLKIEPFSNITESGVAINNGVVDVQCDFNSSVSNNRDLLQEKAIEAAFEQLGDLGSSKYDLVMFCFPPGTGNWLSYSFINSRYSFYNNDWCQYVSAQMHEVGHNLGLANSGEIGEGGYADLTGWMGISYNLDDQHMCFNAAKNYQLGWYADQTRTIYPLSRKGGSIRTYKLNGVADYGKDPESFVVLRLEQFKGNSLEDYYIGFNRKAGINEDTAEDENSVIILRKMSESPVGYGESTKVAALQIGFSHTISNFNGERDVEIRYVAGGFENRFAIIEVVDVERAARMQTDDIPVSCKLFQVEIRTDKYPADNYWIIREDTAIGRAYARSMVFTEDDKLYKQEICLPYGRNYRFDIIDKYDDGLCCDYGEGYYRVINDRDQVVFSGNENFTIRTHYFSVGSNPNPDPENVDNQCQDEKGRHQWKPSGTGEKRPKKMTCKKIKKIGKCDAVSPDGIPLWEYCRKSCDKCFKYMQDV